MKKEYKGLEAIKVNISPAAKMLTGNSQCWQIVTNKLDSGVCTTEEPGHVNEWYDKVDPAYVTYGMC